MVRTIYEATIRLFLWDNLNFVAIQRLKYPFLKTLAIKSSILFTFVGLCDQFDFTVIEEPFMIQNCASETQWHNSHVCTQQQQNQQ
jgi:hypothetical protein